MKYIILLSIFAFLFTALAAPVRAVGLAVTPAELSVKTEIGKEATVRIKIANPSNDVALVELYSDSASSILSFVPSSFTLQAGEERYANVHITTRDAGVIDANLSVVARPLAKAELSAGSGIKIPVHIESVAASSWRNLVASMEQLYGNSNWISLLGVLLVGLGIGYFLKRS